jgi:hypothetical protein
MHIKIIDPTETRDWDSLLLRTEKTDFFHSSGWAKVLKESYRYKPLYFTSSENGRLHLSLPLMEVHSLLTGKRGISLPFADQCIPFSLDRQILHKAVNMCIDYGRRAGWRYIEWRANSYHDNNVPSWADYYKHEISLSGSEALLFARLIPSNRRNINKAIRAGLYIERSSSWDAVNSFYILNSLTRKRHGLPPQPLRFFKMVFEHIISVGHGLVISASYKNKIIASSIYFHFGKQALYKYGASETGSLHLRPNNLIMWEAIKWYRDHKFETISLGRTEMDNPGLLRYKQSWGAKESRLRYYRYDCKGSSFLANMPGKAFYKKILSRTPMGLLRVIGRLIYRHVG